VIKSLYQALLRCSTKQGRNLSDSVAFLPKKLISTGGEDDLNLSVPIEARLSNSLYHALLRWSEEEGRSLSDLIAFLLEKAVADSQGMPND
jgi:hypothetical protein